jgi:hypothetical protein
MSPTMIKNYPKWAVFIALPDGQLDTRLAKMADSSFSLTNVSIMN